MVQAINVTCVGDLLKLKCLIFLVSKSTQALVWSSADLCMRPVKNKKMLTSTISVWANFVHFTEGSVLMYITIRGLGGWPSPSHIRLSQPG